MGTKKGLKDPVSWGIALSAALLATVAMMPVAKAELVYENEVQNPPARVEDREATRQVLNSSEKAQNAVRIQQYVPVPRALTTDAPMVQVQNTVPVQAAASASATSEVQNLSKTELMRRERVREEVKNEDILQERLEELRLRDEKKRTEQVLGLAPNEGVVTGAQAVGPITEQTVVTPITEGGRPEVAATAIATTGAGVVLPPAPRADQLAVSSAAAVSTTESKEDKTQVFVEPRFGLSDMKNSGYDIRPRYTAGIGLGMIVSENISFDIGYAYSEYGIAMNPTNPFVAYWGTRFGYNPNFETVAMKQNLVDAGIKLHMLGQDSRLRPFIGAGGGYAKSFVNYDSKILNNLNQAGLNNYGSDYEISSFLGYLSTGLDVRVNKNIMVGANFKYYTVLSEREQGQLNNAALYGYPGGYYGGVNPYYSSYGTWTDPDKQMVGGTLARTSFYSITGEVSFSF